MLPFLHTAERNSWHPSWLVISHGFLKSVTASHSKSRERWYGHKAETRHSEQKFMFTIMWNSRGFYIVDKLQNNVKMNNEYFITERLSPFEQSIFPRRRTRHQKLLMIHIDNCSVHASPASAHWFQEPDMHHIPHPPYLLYLAPSDFHLLPIMK
jgi:hypothetical protein